MCASRERQRMAEIAFETLGVPAYYVANQASLALLASGLAVQTGLVVQVWASSPYPTHTHTHMHLHTHTHTRVVVWGLPPCSA
jgi:hypothetical protein